MPGNELAPCVQRPAQHLRIAVWAPWVAARSGLRWRCHHAERKSRVRDPPTDPMSAEIAHSWQVSAPRNRATLKPSRRRRAGSCQVAKAIDTGAVSRPDLMFET